MGDAHVALSNAPAGFARFVVARSEIVCLPRVADSVREALGAGTLYHYAQRHPAARPLVGRGVVYAVPLPYDVEHAVVRHNHHGGLFAPLTRDLFRPPTRAPAELRIAEWLRERDVPTPMMLGFVLYDALLGFKRVDVMTREVPNSFDLSTALMSHDAEHRTRSLLAAAHLVLALSNVGAHHHDLNVKNILLHPAVPASDGALEACVLDVDRITYEEPEFVLELNLRRLLRSARKWQEIHGALVTDAELDELAGLVRERRPPPVPESTSS